MAIAKKIEEVSKKTKVLVCNFKAYDLPDSYEEYIKSIRELPDDFIVQLAPAYTDLKEVSRLA